MPASDRALALMKKGLRPRVQRRLQRLQRRPSACPDEEGIKTASAGGFAARRIGPSACPDEEGIKTSSADALPIMRLTERLP